jgi:hypothetical protein
MSIKQYVDATYLEVEGTTVECSEINWKGSVDGQEPGKIMRKDNTAGGYTGGALVYELTIVVPLPEAGLPVDLESLFKNKTLFSAAVEYKGGKRRTFVYCLIKDIDSPSRVGEGVQQTFTCDALDMR